MIKQSLITIATLGLMTLSVSAEANLKACTTCHGADFEKKALNVSKIVKDMSKDEIIASLKGYQEDKGGAMKGVMKGQVAKLSDADIAEMAAAIAGDDKKEEAKAEDANATKTEDNATKEDAAPAAKVDLSSCTTCHGKDFEKVAMNVSKVVKDMTKADIEAALKGYQKGEGGKMAALMKGQVSKYSADELKAIADQLGK